MLSTFKEANQTFNLEQTRYLRLEAAWTNCWGVLAAFRSDCQKRWLWIKMLWRNLDENRFNKVQDGAVKSGILIHERYVTCGHALLIDAGSSSITGLVTNTKFLGTKYLPSWSLEPLVQVPARCWFRSLPSLHKQLVHLSAIAILP